MWYEPLRAIASRGSQTERPGSLAGLAQARRLHLGQFFTPDEVAALMWRLAKPAMDHAVGATWRNIGPITILDNSVGSGRLLQYAEPDKHALYGVDVDADTLAKLGAKAQEAGFDCTFEHCGMEAIDPRGFDVALINPPFSVHLDAPTLVPHPCTTYGRFGPGSAAVSHAYALAQAIEAAELVIALLPRSFVDELLARPDAYLDASAIRRLVLVIHLPPKSFREEGTDVRVSLMVFNHGGRGVALTPQVTLKTLDDPLPDCSGWKLYQRGGKARLNVREVKDDGPSITLPVTGNTDVRVVRDGRRLKLKYHCGFLMAKVENALLRERVRPILGPEHRFPKGVRFEGQGVFDLEVFLAQKQPMGAFNGFIEDLKELGANPVVDPGIFGYLRRASRATRRQATPLRHTVYVKEGTAGNARQMKAKPRRPQVADPKRWGSPALSMDEEIDFESVEDGKYSFTVKGKEYRLSPEDLYERFQVTAGAEEVGWKVVHEGLQKTYPEIASALETRARSLGLDQWVSWSYQFNDLVELSMKPVGAVAAWDMGLGKARLAVALILMNGCRHGLIATEAGLVPEMVTELKGLPIPAEDWQVITSPAQLVALRRINVISYERLRLPQKEAPKGGVKRMRHTYAGALRRRIGVAIFDEGDLLANPSSDQARACAQVSAKKRYVLTGTPLANYPRDVAPILAFTAGDGTAAQPWGWRRGKLDPTWLESMNTACRGIDAFRETFVCTTWATREFEDTLEGAKREIPRIADLDAFRTMLAPHVKRRMVEEPDVAAHIHIPAETREIVQVPWDHDHLAYYLKVVEEFSTFYLNAKADGGRSNNLVAILARIRAVSFASDFPQHGVEGFGPYMPLTSKQRWAIDELERLDREGKKTVLYAENPEQVELIARHLAARGVDSVTFHGKKPIKARTKELNERFREGPCNLLLATMGVVQKGLNLWCAQEAILLSRSWSASIEEQAIHRLLRPQQTQHVRVRMIQLSGGIDYYKGQLVDFKKDSAAAGLDWGTPETEDADFLHLDTIIGRFVEDMARKHSVAHHEVRKLVESMKKGSVVNV